MTINDRHADSDNLTESIGFAEDSSAAFIAEGRAFAEQESEHGGDYDLLGEFLQAAQEETSNTILLPVTSRPGNWVLEFDAVISEAELKRYSDRATLGKVRQGKQRKSSPALMYAMLIAEKNTGIYKGDGADRVQVEDVDGEPLLLNSDAFLESVGEPHDVRAAIRAFLGDAGVGAIGAAILREAGWSEDLTPLDPTER